MGESVDYDVVDEVNAFCQLARRTVSFDYGTMFIVRPHFIANTVDVRDELYLQTNKVVL